MRKNGFTLVEVMAVVTLLGVIAMISIPTIKNMVKDSKQKLYDEQIKMIENGLKNWANSNIFLLPDADGSIKLSLGQLKQAGFLEQEINNPKTNKCFSNESILTIAKYNNGYIYKAEKLEDVNCDLISNSPLIKLNGNAVEHLNVGDTYIDAGATAKDASGKDITSSIATTITDTVNNIDTINTNYSGSYAIIYSVNVDGKTSSVIRNVFVTEKLHTNGIMSANNNCINEGICPNGTKVGVQVNNSINYDFHVIKDTGTKLTLIMDRNIGNKVAWYKDDDDSTNNETNNLGPITALAYLNNQTSDWNNIEPIKNYTYDNNLNGTTHQYGYQKLEIKNGIGILTSQDGIVETKLVGISRARLLTYEEEQYLKAANSGTIPSYLYNNLSSSGVAEISIGYWYLKAYRSSPSNYAYFMSYQGYSDSAAPIYINNRYGVRPVIELSK